MKGYQFLPGGLASMACYCKEPDGSLAYQCNGTCKQKDFKQANYVEQRAEQSVMDKTNYMLSTFLNRLEDRINKIESMCMDNWKEGYRQGFEDGSNS